MGGRTSRFGIQRMERAEPWSVHWIELWVPFLHALSHPLLSRRFISRLSSLHT